VEADGGGEVHRGRRGHGERVVCCPKVGGVRPLVLFSPTRFHKKILARGFSGLVRISRIRNKRRERSEKRPVRVVHFPHGLEVGGGIEVMDPVLSRAIMAMGRNWVSHGASASDTAHVRSRVAGEARCALGSRRLVPVKKSDPHGDVKSMPTYCDCKSARRVAQPQRESVS
jgi:hypothetical protein